LRINRGLDVDNIILISVCFSWALELKSSSFSLAVVTVYLYETEIVAKRIYIWQNMENMEELLGIN